jgi:hypothetical protein
MPSRADGVGQTFVLLAALEGRTRLQDRPNGQLMSFMRYVMSFRRRRTSCFAWFALQNNPFHYTRRVHAPTCIQWDPSRRREPFRQPAAVPNVLGWPVPTCNVRGGSRRILAHSAHALKVNILANVGNLPTTVLPKIASCQVRSCCRPCYDRHSSRPTTC